MNHNNQLLPEDLYQQMVKDRKVRTAVTKESFAMFFHFYFSHYVKSATAPFQKEIMHLLESDPLRNLHVVAFRGSGKSTMVTTAYPIWALLGKQEKKFIVIFCQTKVQARQHMMNIRNELENNNMLKDDLGPFQEEADEWGAHSLVFSRSGARLTVASVEQSIRGIRHHQYRPDLIVADDVEDLASTKTRDSRNKTYEWLKSEVIPAGDQNTRLVIVGNLLHEDSLILRIKGELEEGKMAGDFKFYPLLDDKENCLWPGKYPDQEAIEAEKKRVGNEISWQREFLLKIVPTDYQVVHREWIQYYDELPPRESRKPYRYENTSAGVDLAITDKASSDYTAIVGAQVHGRKKMRKIYILPHIINSRMLFPEIIETCRNYQKTTLDRGKLYIESVAFQAALPQLLRREGRYVEEVQVRGDKRSRLAITSPLIQNGTILFPRKGAEELIQQLVGFGVEKHDDLVDAFTLLVHKLIEEDDRPRPNLHILCDGEWSSAINYDDEWDD